MYGIDGDLSAIWSTFANSLYLIMIWQVFTPWIQERRKEIAQKMIIKAGVMSNLLKRVDRASLINEHGVLDEHIAEKYAKGLAFSSL